MSSDNMITMCKMSKRITYPTDILGFFVLFALHIDVIPFRKLIRDKVNKKRSVSRSRLYHGNVGIPVFSCGTRKSVSITFGGGDAWKLGVTKQCDKT